jgi:hypothetical protein
VTTPSDRAYAAIPNYEQLTSALTRLARHTAGLTPPPDPTAELTAEVRDALLGGKPIPPDLGRRLTEGEDEQRRLRAEGLFLGVPTGTSGTGLYGQLRAEREQALRAGCDTALGVLADALAEVLTVAASADATLGGIRTAEQAAVHADTEQADAWRSLVAAVATYGDIRTTQANLLVRAGHGDPARVARDLEDSYIRNVAEVDPYWKARIAGELEVMNDAVLAARSPWPSPRVSRGAGPWPTTDKPSYVRWLATSDADPWVPTRRELRRHLDALASAERAAAAERARPSTGQERALVAAHLESRPRQRY